MSKKPNLADVFSVDQAELQPKADVVELQEPTAKQPKPKKRHIGGYFNEKVYRQLKVIGAEEDMTTQDMLAQALNAFFRIHDKPPIA